MVRIDLTSAAAEVKAAQVRPGRTLSPREATIPSKGSEESDESDEVKEGE